MENGFRNVICWVCLYWILEYKKDKKEEQKKFYLLMEMHEEVRKIEWMEKINLTYTVIIPFDPI